MRKCTMNGSKTGIFLGCPHEPKTEPILGRPCVSRAEMYPTCPDNVDGFLINPKHRHTIPSMHMRCHPK